MTFCVFHSLFSGVAPGSSGGSSLGPTAAAFRRSTGPRFAFAVNWTHAVGAPIGDHTDQHLADDSEAAALPTSEPLERSNATQRCTRRDLTNGCQVRNRSGCAPSTRFAPRQAEQLADKSTAHEAFHVRLNPVHMTDSVLHGSRYLRSSVWAANGNHGIVRRSERRSVFRRTRRAPQSSQTTGLCLRRAAAPGEDPFERVHERSRVIQPLEQH